MSQPIESLQPLELNPWRVLVIAAHPGDIELGASAAVAKWTSEGAEVIYLIATRGELSMPGVEPDEAALIRTAEQSAAAAAVGVGLVDFLDIDDGTVEPNVRLRRAIVGDLRRYGPDVVMIMNHREHEADGSRNDADHRAVGTAALDAVSAAGNQWAFRDIGDPHTVDTVLVASSPTPTHAIDVTGFEADAVRAFSAHEEHLVSVADHPMTDLSWLTSALKADSERVPESTAVIAVERIEYAKGRPCHSSIVKEIEDLDGPMMFLKSSDRPALSKNPSRARNAAPSSQKQKKKPRKAKAEAPKPADSKTGAMKFETRLEQRGRLIGIEVPTNVMERLHSSTVTVELRDTTFESAIRKNNAQDFIAINAERRKAAAIAVDDTFFVGLSTPGVETPSLAAEATDESLPEEPVGKSSPKRNHRKRPTRRRAKG